MRRLNRLSCALFAVLQGRRRQASTVVACAVPFHGSAHQGSDEAAPRCTFDDFVVRFNHPLESPRDGPGPSENRAFGVLRQTLDTA